MADTTLGTSFIIAGIILVAGATIYLLYTMVDIRLKRAAREEAHRLRMIFESSSDSGHTPRGDDPNPPPPPLAGDQRVDDDKFAELLIEYYAWGLTQARLTTTLSLICSGLGIAVIVGGAALAVWNAETTGGLYASIVTSLAGVVSTVIGHLGHRRADAAMGHMTQQSEALRQDMRRERELEASIRLVREVADPALRSHLQAALTLRLGEASLPDLPMQVLDSLHPGTGATSLSIPGQNGAPSHSGSSPV